ncbi:acyl carrier protein [Streptomyces sp. NPDC056061]|uniref:acyl carrier protein n=1 Tax=Streptomyces sp. NPDC056061 TaxID=3345700 RepID=UPI0035D66AD4
MPTTVTAEAVLDLIRTELVDSGVEEDTIEPDAKFDDLDIDSLDAAELMATIKRTYGVTIPRAELADVTVGRLASDVAEKAGL